MGYYSENAIESLEWNPFKTLVTGTKKVGKFVYKYHPVIIGGRIMYKKVAVPVAKAVAEEVSNMEQIPDEVLGQLTPVIPSDLVPLFLKLEKVYGRDKALKYIDQYGFDADKFLPTGIAEIKNLGQVENEPQTFFQEVNAKVTGFFGELTGFILIAALLYIAWPFLKGARKIGGVAGESIGHRFGREG